MKTHPHAERSFAPKAPIGLACLNPQVCVLTKNQAYQNRLAGSIRTTSNEPSADMPMRTTWKSLNQRGILLLVLLPSAFICRDGLTPLRDINY